MKRAPVRLRLVGLVSAVAFGMACATAPPPVDHVPTREGYAEFAAAHAGLYEPNYLPFMAYRVPDDGEGDWLVLCRWSAEDMPLRVHVPPFEVPADLQDDIYPRDTGGYVPAVFEALATWERELDGLVRFDRADSPDAADIIVQLHAAPAPHPDADHTVLGRTRLGDACRVTGRAPDGQGFRVRFRVPALEIYLADEYGLLSADQVHRIALHELGHALGMRGHSPIPADLMYEVVRDRVQLAEGLSFQDVNSFASLYRLAPGAVYGRVRAHGPVPATAPPGEPALAMAPYVDARHGFRVRLPRGWVHFETRHGMAAVDGTTWDYRASFQVAVQRYATIDAFLERYGAYYLQRGHVGAPRELRIDGRRAGQSEIFLRDAPRVEQVTLVEVGDGRVLVVTADCPRGELDDYLPWFTAVLRTLRVVDQPEDAWPARR